MPLNVTFLGHSGFLFDDGRWALAVDPFLTGNPLAVHKPSDIRCQYVALTHGHADHMGDTATIAKANGATLIAVYEICDFLAGQGVKSSPANVGGKVQTEFGWVAFTQAVHSSSYEGRYMGTACGLVIRMGGVTVYHCGDTALFSDMNLIALNYQPDIACIPIGDRFTMGPELATRAAEMIRPEVAIPMHYPVPDSPVVDARDFKPTGMEVKPLKPGDKWRYE